MKKLSEEAPVLFEISRFIHAHQHFDERTIQQARLVIADTLGTAFSGVKTGVFQKAMSNEVYALNEGEFRVWGTNNISTLAGAMFYNTLSVSSTDFDEGHRRAVGHPASLVVPTALLLGQHLRKPFSEVINAVIIGYEVGTRFSSARVREKISSYSTGRWGGMATAATASYLLGLTVEQTVHALSNAAVLSPAMLGGSTDVSTGSMSKEGVAWAAQSGFQASLMAKNDFSGPYLFVDGTEDFNKNILLENLGKEWFINSNYFKPYACCRWLHPAIHASILLKEENNISPLEINKIEVEVFSRAFDLINTTYPENTIQAQFHLPYVVSCALFFSQVHPAHFNQVESNKPVISELIEKMVIIANNEYSQAFPKKIQSKVRIEMLKGEVYSKEMLQSPWDAGSHPTKNELRIKFSLQTEGKMMAIFDKITGGSANNVLDIVIGEV